MGEVFKFPVIRDLEKLKRIVDQLMKKKVLYSLDIETDSLSRSSGRIVGASICTSKDGAFYVPFRHQHDQPFDGVEAMRVLRGLFTDYPFIAFNAQFELSFLEETEGIVHNCEVYDPMIMSYVIGRYRGLSLKEVAEVERLPFKVGSFKEFMQEEGLNPRKATIGALPTDKVADYCGRDALACYLLYKKLKPLVEKSLIYKIESRLMPVVYKMIKNGVLIDKVYFKKEQERLDLELSALHKSIEAQVSVEAGEEVSFNVASTQQLGEVLFNVLGYPCDGYTKTGRPKVDKKSLNKMKWKYPIVRDIIAFKEISKRATTYYNKYLGYVEDDGRIHASYNQTGVPTGRFSCSSPNLQNIPRKEKWKLKDGKEIEINTREGFIAPEGSFLVEFDYSQIEARVAAAVTGEPALVNTFQKGEDYHTKTASLVFEIPLDKVTKKQRYLGKKLNFALSYGMGANALFHELREEMDISFKQAQMFRRKYIEAYRLMFDGASKIAKEGRPRGRVETIFGRYISVWDWEKREDADRMAYNAVIQGTSADILKMKMLKMDKVFKDKVKLIMTTHDSLTYEVPEEINISGFIKEAEKVLKFILKEEDGFRARIEIPVNTSVGYRWGSMKELKDYNGDVEKLLKELSGDEKEEPGERIFVLDLPEHLLATMNKSVLEELKAYIKSKPGVNGLILKLGEEERRLPVKTSIDMKDRDKLMLMTGGNFYEYF